jgi:hypothetical protein
MIIIYTCLNVGFRKFRKFSGIDVNAGLHVDTCTLFCFDADIRPEQTRLSLNCGQSTDRRPDYKRPNLTSLFVDYRPKTILQLVSLRPHYVPHPGDPELSS